MTLKLLSFFNSRRIIFLVLIVFCTGASNSLAATLTVTKTADTNDGVCSADCSLREAISKTVAGDTIAFNIPTTDTGCSGDICTITPTSALPTLSKGSVTIDGYSQSGALANTNDFPNPWNGTIKIVLNGTSAGASSNGLQATSTNNIIKGLAINRFLLRGVYVNNKSGNKVQGCIIGLDNTGETIQKNNSQGVYITGTASTGTVIGTDGDGSNDAAERNIISGNGSTGIYVASGGQNTIAGNFMGTNKDGTTDLGNSGGAINLASSTANQNVIGTDGDGVYDAFEGNLISGNAGTGINISSSYDVVAGNIIGMNAAATAAIKNDSGGIGITGSSTRIGTNGDWISDEFERNIISGNSGTSQRQIQGSGTGIIIAGNLIGLDRTGTTYFAAERGIESSATSSGWIIGTNGDGINDAVEQNVMAGQTYNVLLNGTNHVVAGNLMCLNATGTAAVGPSSAYGIRVTGGSNDRIGTNADGVSDDLERNIISGCGGAAVTIEGGGTGVVVAGNYIGTDITGLVGIGNGTGLVLGYWNGTTAANINRVGTNGDGANDEIERNIIAMSTNDGLSISNGSSNTVAGNFIGLGSDGVTALGNRRHGISWTYNGGSNNLIGGDTEAEKNIIANNGNASGEYGMKIVGAASDNNQILKNSFYNNTSGGIKLNGDGANNNIVKPTVTGQRTNGSDIDLLGTSPANATLQLFLADSDHQEGETFMGETTAAADGSWTYTLTDHKEIGTIFVSTATTVTDGTSEFSAAYTLTNESPTADVQTLSTLEDTKITVTLSGDDANEDVISYLVSNLPTHGTLYQTLDGSTQGDAITLVPTTVSDSEHRLIYVPEINNNGIGVGSFGFKTNDGSSNSSEATISIDVTAVQDVPTTLSTLASTDEDRSTAFMLPAADVDGDVLTYSIVTAPAHGTITSLNTITGAVTYAPTENFNGTDTFTFRVHDGMEYSNTSEALITIRAVNDTPQAASVTVATNEDESTDVTLAGSDVDTGDTLTYQILSGPTQGSVSNINAAAGTLTYTPLANYSGTDSLNYRVTDTSFQSATASVTISVVSVNDAPVATNVLQAVNKNASGLVLLAASDIDGDALSYSIVTQPAHGALSALDTHAGSVTYTPTTNFEGTDTFTFRASDVAALSNTAIVSLTVGDGSLADNTAPVVDAGLTRDEVAGTTINLRGSASDIEGDTLTYAWSQAAGTAVSIENDNTLTASFVASDDLAGETLTFTLTVDDGSESTQDSVSIRILQRERTTEKTVLIPQRLIDIDGSGNRIVEDLSVDHGNVIVNQITLWSSCLVLTCTENEAVVQVIDANHVAIGDPYCDNNRGSVVLLDRGNLDCSTDVDLNNLDTTARPGLLVALGSAEGNYFGESLKLGDLDGNQTQELYVSAPGNNYGAIYGLELSTLRTLRLIAGSQTEQLRSSLTAFANIDGTAGTEALIGLAPSTTDAWTDSGPLSGIVSGVTSTFDVISAASDLPGDIDFSYTGSDSNITTANTITQIMTGLGNEDSVEDVIFGSAFACSFEFLFGQGSALADSIDLTGNTSVTCSELGVFENAFIADVSGDGYSDLIVGFPDENNGNGLVAVLPGPFEADETSYSFDNAVLISGNTGERVGERLFVGDYDGDGVMDIFTSSFTDNEDKTKAIIFSDANAQAMTEPDVPNSQSGENDGDNDGSDISGLSAAGAGCALDTQASLPPTNLFFIILSCLVISRCVIASRTT